MPTSYKPVKWPDGREVQAGELVQGKKYIFDLRTGTIEDPKRKVHIIDPGSRGGMHVGQYGRKK